MRACDRQNKDCCEIYFFYFIFFGCYFIASFQCPYNLATYFLPTTVFVVIIHEIRYCACFCFPFTQINMNRQPIVTGTSVIGITYKGGVMLAADTLGPFEQVQFLGALCCSCDFSYVVMFLRFLRFLVTFQGPDTDQSNWRQYPNWGWGRSQ